MNIKCIGCGVEIQTEKEEELGYLPKSAFEKKSPDDLIYCKRCFTMRNYNKGEKSEMTNDDFIKIVSSISNTNSLVVKIIDIFDFSGSFIDAINRLTGQSDVLLVGNKLDLLPKSVKKDKVVRWMRRQSNMSGLKVIDATLISSLKGNGIDEALKMIEKYRKGRDVYVVGATNVGKSSFINSILKRYADETRNVITVSALPGTTLNLIEIPLSDSESIYDTPGILNEHQIVHQLDFDSYKKIIPTKEIKPKVYQLNSDQTIFMGGIASFSFLKGERTSFVFHFSNNLNLHRTKTSNATELFEKHKGVMLSPPTLEEINNNEFVTHSFKISGDKKYDIVISGLGFITVNAEVTVEIMAFKNVGVFLREAII